MNYRAFLLFGCPGSGKGTVGRVIGSIPGFYHLSTGDAFRTLDFRSEVAQAFLKYATDGQLVPDEWTMRMFDEHLEKMVASGKFKPELDHLLLDGIPRTVTQVKALESRVEVRRVFHLDSQDRAGLQQRLAKRALKESRPDDASATIIARRFAVYDAQTKPVLDCYPPEMVVSVNADQYPYLVIRDVLGNIQTGD